MWTDFFFALDRLALDDLGRKQKVMKFVCPRVNSPRVVFLSVSDQTYICDDRPAEIRAVETSPLWESLLSAASWSSGMILA